MQLPPAYSIISTQRSAGRAKIQIVEFMVAAHHDPILRAHDVNNLRAKRSSIDQITIDNNGIRLQSF